VVGGEEAANKEDCKEEVHYGGVARRRLIGGEAVI